MDKHNRALTPAELYAVEKAARRMRAEAQAELMSAAVRWVKNAFATAAFRPYAHPGKVVRHA